MSLIDDVYKLHPHQVKEACDVMLDASIAMEVGNDWRMHFKRAMHKTQGRQRRIYKIMSQLSADEMDSVSKSLADVVTTQ